MFQTQRKLFAFLPAFLVVLSGAGAAVAQQGPATIRLLPEDEKRAGNGHQHNFYYLPPGITGENYVDAGFFGQHLRPLLAGNDEALTNLAKYRRQKTIFLADRVVSVGAFAYYGVKVLEKDKFPQYDSDGQKVAAGVFIASILATIVINHNTNNHLHGAVDAYNASKARGAVWPRLRPSGLGLGTVQGHPTLALSWTVQ